MKRFLGISVAAFIALIAFALISVDSSAVAGLRDGCHGRRCHGRSHDRSHGLRHRRQNRCHGEQANCCESNECSSGCADGNCGGGAVITEEAAPTKAAEAPAAPAKT
ncbi:hypothetical protein N9B10_05195 [Pirellulales bacterium]|nr:hypothetical protein [Pirellulales bacterium]